MSVEDEVIEIKRKLVKIQSTKGAVIVISETTILSFLSSTAFTKNEKKKKLNIHYISESCFGLIENTEASQDRFEYLNQDAHWYDGE